MARPRKELEPVSADLEQLIPSPRVEVIERGLANVFGLPSAQIELKRKDMVCHWCNTAIAGNQLGKYLDAGYLKVRPEMLADPDRVAFRVSPDGYVTNGQRHEEILLYTLTSNYLARQKRKSELNRKSMTPGGMKQEVVNAASAALGDEAGDFLNRHSGPVGNVHDSYERIAVRPGDE
jgi:hypothetical protein